MIPLRDNAPTRHFPVVTVGLIVANVLTYFLFQDGGTVAAEGPVREYAYQPCEVNDSCPVEGEDWPLTSFTSMFMHGDIVHLGGNMLFLWIFGNNVEDAMGRIRYVVFYLLAGYAATALQTGVTLEISPESAAIPNLGASGAISGVLGAYLLILPHAKVLTAIVLGFIFFLREIPALFFLGIYFLFQLWQAGGQWTNPPQGGGVAVFAHVGGFVFGLATVYLFRKRAPLRPRY
ncbi:MAG TPA: rhomboid family intramembrane serine protease [Solirubrobacterales bacterium]|nr:rhomboid family intramembrane serine protease [Solirubrobacterales bacterium]